MNAGSGGRANAVEVVNEVAHVVTFVEDREDVLEYAFVAGQALTAGMVKEQWVGDSGAGVHVVNNCELFHTYQTASRKLDGVGSLPILG